MKRYWTMVAAFASVCFSGCVDQGGNALMLFEGARGIFTWVFTALGALFRGGVVVVMFTVALTLSMMSGCSQMYQSGKTGANKPGVEVHYGWLSGLHIYFNSDGCAKAQQIGLTKNDDGTVNFNLTGLDINQTPSVTDLAEAKKMEVMVDLWDRQVLLAHEISQGVNDLAEKISNMVNPPKGIIEALAKIKATVDLQKQTLEIGDKVINIPIPTPTPTPPPAEATPATKG